MRKLITILSLFALVMVPLYVIADTQDEVGGVPFAVQFDGTSAATAADVTVTTAPGFVPDYIIFFDDYDDLTAQNIYFWVNGMGNGSIVDNDGAENKYVSSAGSGCWFDVSTAGQIIVDAACQENSGNYVGFASRARDL